MEEVAFHRIQQLDEEYLKHVAGVLKLKDTSTKLYLFKVILGYLNSITISTYEGNDISEAVNDFLEKTFLAKTIYKEKNKKQTLQQNQRLELSNQSYLIL